MPLLSYTSSHIQGWITARWRHAPGYQQPLDIWAGWKQVGNALEPQITMLTSWHGHTFCITAPLQGKSTGHWWIRLTKGVSNAEIWCFLCCWLQQVVEQTSVLPDRRQAIMGTSGNQVLWYHTGKLDHSELTHSLLCDAFLLTHLSCHFADALSWMKKYEFLLSFHRSLFLSVQLIICQRWFRWWLCIDQAYDDLIYLHIYAPLDLSELHLFSILVVLTYSFILA